MSSLLVTPLPRKGFAALLLATDDFARNFAAFTPAGVEWVRPPATQDDGKVAVFADLYGNLWDLVEFSAQR